MLLSTRRNTRSRLGVIALALVALALVVLPSAEDASAQSEPLAVSVVGFSADDWPAPQAILTVEDGQGRPLADLEPSAFQAFLEDDPAPVTSVTRAVDGSLPIAVVLAMDVSGSMEGAALDQAKAAAGGFLEGLGQLDTVAILTFSDTVTLVQPFTLDRGAAGAVIDGLVAEGETALYDATSESARLAGGAESSRRAVVLLSDGLDNGSALSRGEALAAAETLGVPVFAIGLGDIDRDYLGALADATGGQFAEASSPEALTLLYAQVAERLRGQYVVTLNTTAFETSRADAATLRIEVASGERAGGGERLICPQSVCVAISALSDGERLEAARTVSAEVVAEDPVTAVNFLVDGQVLATVSDPPYEFTLDPGAIAQGEHAFAVEVTTAGGSSEVRRLTVQLGAAAGGSSMSVGLLLIGAIAFVVIALVLWFFMRWRRRGDDEAERRPVAIPQPPLAPKSEVPILERLERERIDAPAPAIEEVRGLLRAMGGPIQGETFSLGGNPVSLGSGSRCRIKLEDNVDGAEIPSEYARVWIREGKLMVHELRRLTAVGSVGGRWEILASGDMFSVGPYTFRFELAEDEIGPSGTNGAAGDVPGKAANGASASPVAPAAGPADAGAAAPATPGRFWTGWKPEAGSRPANEPPANDPAPEPASVPAPTEEPAVPNVLRSRPPAEEAVLSSTAQPSEEAPAVPNVLRDRPRPSDATTPDPAGQPEPEVPNVLRDHPERAAQPAQDDSGERQGSL